MQLKVSTDYAIRIVLYTAITRKITSRFATEDCPVRNFYCKMQRRFEDDLKNTSIKELL